MATVTALADANIVGENEEQLVTMVVDNQLFGIPILQVQDIVEASKITPVPLAPSAIAGVLNLRGRIVTVIDLRKLMGNDEEVPWDGQMGVTVDHKGDLYTLLVDAIGDVRSLSKRDFDKTPSTLESEVKRLCSGIYRLRGNLLVVLDVGRILEADVIAATPMLTVEERKKRKLAAMRDSKGDDGRARQLSTLMTDLRAYEAEMAADQQSTGLGDAAHDDIKSRKRASRTRRPVSDRWKEVLDQRNRQQGKVIYRMREPDEEALEEARLIDREADERIPGTDDDAAWQARVRLDVPGDGPNEPAARETAPAGPDGEGADEIVALDNDGAAPPATADDGESKQPGAVSGWWNRLGGNDDGGGTEGPGAQSGPETQALEDGIEPAGDTPDPGTVENHRPAADASPPAELETDGDAVAKSRSDEPGGETADRPAPGKATSKTASSKRASTAKPSKSTTKTRTRTTGKKK